MLKQRVITSICGLPVLIAAIWFDNFLPWFTLLAAILGLLISLEFSRLVNTSITKSFTVYGAFATICLIVLRDGTVMEWIGSFSGISWSPVIQILLLLLPIPVSRFIREKNWKAGLWTTAGILFIGWTLGNLVAIRGLEEGRNWIFITLFAVFAYDTSAYFTGRSLGKHKMAPKVSPGKTWEGAAGGITGAILLCLFFTLSTPLGLPLSWGHALVLGIAISIAAQSGDLLESWFKRYIRVKDSGNVLPGHGGFMDRLDSIVITSVVVYYYVIWVIQ